MNCIVSFILSPTRRKRIASLVCLDCIFLHSNHELFKFSLEALPLLIKVSLPTRLWREIFLHFRKISLLIPCYACAANTQAGCSQCTWNTLEANHENSLINPAHSHGHTWPRPTHGTPIKHQLRKISSYDLLTILLDVVAFSQMLSILHNQLSLVALEQCCTACYVRTISLYLTLITNKLHCSVSMVDILLSAIGCIRCPHDGAKTHLLHKPLPLPPFLSCPQI